MTELELVTRLAPDVPLDDPYAQAARARALERLGQGIRAEAPRSGRRVRRRLLAVAGTGALAAAALLLLLTRVGGDDSAIARARAALALPATGLLIVDSHTFVTRAGRVTDAHYASWQSLDRPADRRFLQTDPDRGTLVDRSSLGGLVMRYDRTRGVVFTQRVIVSPNAAIESEGVLSAAARLRTLLGSPHMRDRGETSSAGRTYRRLSYASGRTTCDYLVDPATFRPAHLDCVTAPGDGGAGVHDVVAYRIAPATRANERLLDVRAAYPDARVEHDPNGIPGRAGNDLADITQPARYPFTLSDPLLQRTDDAALRAAKRLQASTTRATIACLARHGGWSAKGATNDPTSTLQAICQYRQDDAAAVTRTPAGRELLRRGGDAATAAWACIRKGTRAKPGLDADAKHELERACAASTRDPIAGGLEVAAKP